MKESELFKKLITMEEMHSKAKAFDVIMKECQDNPTKSRKWVLSLMKRSLKKTSKKTKEKKLVPPRSGNELADVIKLLEKATQSPILTNNIADDINVVIASIKDHFIKF